MVVITEIPTRTRSEWQLSALTDVAKKQLQIEDTFDDEYIAELIDTAFELIEADTNSDVFTWNNELTFVIQGGLKSRYRIVRSPLKSFVKMEAETDTGWLEVKQSKYTVINGFHWFTVDLLEQFPAKTLKFSFATGFDLNKIPAVLRQAAMLKVSDLYDSERQGYTLSSVAPNSAYQHLISKHIRQYW